MGEFYWFVIPLLLVGVFAFITDQNIAAQKKRLVFAWLLIAPLPASLTYDGGAHATRLILLLPPLIIISATAAWRLVNNFAKSKFYIITTAIVFILALANVTFYFHRYYTHYPIESWRWWQTGYKDAFTYIKDHQNEYDTIVINNTYEPALIRFLFYMKYNPADFHQKFSGDKPAPNILPGIDGFALDKYFFGTLSAQTKGADELAKVLNPRMLYLVSQRDEIVGDLDLRFNAPENVKVLKTITSPVNEPIFYLVTAFR